MPKYCWICKNTEGFFLKQKEGLLKSIEQEISECEKIESSIIDVTKEKLGFTDELKVKVKSIQKVYSEMTLNAVLENKDNFLKLEPNLDIVLDYCLKYGYRNLKTIGNVVENYLSEPLENRYADELRQNKNRKLSLLQRKEKLEGIKTFFIEKVITPQSLDSELQKSRRVPKDYNQGYGNSIIIHNPQDRTSVQRDFSFSYKDLGFDFEKKVFICPICMSFFLEASNASFDVIESQRRAQYDACDDDGGCGFDDLDDEW